jgi:tRNA G18 (ribose-2'-O)-methylase SpoU
MNRAIRIDNANDPRLAPFLDLKDRRLASQQGLFVVEGMHLVNRLLASSFPVHAVVCAENRLSELPDKTAERCPIYLLSEKILSTLVGFAFHRGAVAAGVRRPLTELSRWRSLWPESFGLVVCPEVNDVENLGAVVRSAAAFGAEAMVLGKNCCDPFARRAIRASMGAVFSLPLLQSDDLASDLQSLHDRQGMQRIATVIDPDARPLQEMAPPSRFALLLGTEARGLADPWINLCDNRVTIPMACGIDSLNVAVAAGVFFYHYFQSRAVHFEHRPKRLRLT